MEHTCPRRICDRGDWSEGWKLALWLSFIMYCHTLAQRESILNYFRLEA